MEKKHFQMTLAENTRERSLCGKDLNRLETSFVEINQRFVVFHYFKRSVEHKHTDFVSLCSLLLVEQSEKILHFHLFQNSLSIKAFSDISIILEFLRVQKPRYVTC